MVLDIIGKKNKSPTCACLTKCSKSGFFLTFSVAELPHSLLMPTGISNNKYLHKHRTSALIVVSAHLIFFWKYEFDLFFTLLL